MREVQRKIVDIRNPTHIVLKTDEEELEDMNNISDSENPSPIQVTSRNTLPFEEERRGEEVEIERTKGEKVPDRSTMSRTTSMDGTSEWEQDKKDYVFDATLKKTRNQLDTLKE